MPIGEWHLPDIKSFIIPTLCANQFINFGQTYGNMIADMEPSVDKSQFGNQKGLATAHYLVKMLNRILTILDSNDHKQKYAVVCQLIDWSKAFDRQDHRLGIEALLRTGVRPSLLPILASFFQQRTMTVKWNNCVSFPRELPGGGPQGSVLGNILYGGFSNDNADVVPTEMKYKFVDDLSTLEKINLILAGLVSYNFLNHVASDIATDHRFLDGSNLESQQYLNYVQEWTRKNKAKLNTQKTNVMIFNFTENDQFTTRLYLENNLLETVQQTKLLGTIVTNDLKWDKNTDMLVQKAFKRMQILHKLYSFSVSQSDLVEIYILYIRSVLEFNCQVWHFSLTESDAESLERVQKVACKVILKSNYENYDDALSVLGLETLKERRLKLCIKFATKCTRNPKTASMFPLNDKVNYNLRQHESYYVQPARTNRLRDSSIPQMQRALNKQAKKTYKSS